MFYRKGILMLEVTYAFIGFIMGGLALIISLYVWLTMDEAMENGRAWMQLNRELKAKIEKMERSSPSTPWKK
jgi:hypothetical protein